MGDEVASDLGDQVVGDGLQVLHRSDLLGRDRLHVRNKPIASSAFLHDPETGRRNVAHLTVVVLSLFVNFVIRGFHLLLGKLGVDRGEDPELAACEGVFVKDALGGFTEDGGRNCGVDFSVLIKALKHICLAYGCVCVFAMMYYWTINRKNKNLN